MKLKETFKQAITKITDDKFRYRVQLVIFPILFFFVALVMSILNIFTKEYILLISTASIALVCLVCGVISIITEKGSRAIGLIFVTAVIALFTFFLITGGTSSDNFSNYWIMILPLTAMIILGLKYGSILSGVMLVIILVILETPVRGMIPAKYTDIFCTRFPLVYGACFACGALMEIVRMYTAKQLRVAEEKIRESSYIDSMTGLKNQTYISYQNIHVYDTFKEGDMFGVLFIDIDTFKQYNDKYGHLFGNEVIIAVARALDKEHHFMAGRWGGDEFMIVEKNCTNTQLVQVAQQLIKNVREIHFDEHPEITVSISIGIENVKVGKNFDPSTVIDKADKRNGKAKQTGKDKFVFEEEEDN